MAGGNGGCIKDPDFQTEDDENTEEERSNQDRVSDYIERTWNQKDLSAIDGLVADNYIRHCAGGALRGRQALRELVEATHAVCPDLRVDIEEVIPAGDRVMTRVAVSGTDEGGFRTTAGTGKRIRVTSMLVFRLASGEIHESWHLWDEGGMLAQLGLLSRPAQSS